MTIGQTFNESIEARVRDRHRAQLRSCDAPCESLQAVQLATLDAEELHKFLLGRHTPHRTTHRRCWPAHIC